MASRKKRMRVDSLMISKRARNRILLASSSVLVFMAGVVLVRCEVLSASFSGPSGHESLPHGYGHLSDAAARAQVIALVRIAGEPHERSEVSNSITLVQREVEAEVLTYLKGTSSQTITVAQDYTEQNGNGPPVPVDYYVPMPIGHTYVLLLRADAPPGTWHPGAARPIGFEVQGDKLLATQGSGGVAPVDWGL